MFEWLNDCERKSPSAHSPCPREHILSSGQWEKIIPSSTVLICYYPYSQKSLSLGHTPQKIEGCSLPGEEEGHNFYSSELRFIWGNVSIIYFGETDSQHLHALTDRVSLHFCVRNCVFRFLCTISTGKSNPCDVIGGELMCQPIKKSWYFPFLLCSH